MNNAEQDYPPIDELFIGIVKAVGTDISGALAELHRLLQKAEYHSEPVYVSEFWKSSSRHGARSNRYRSILNSMNEGNNARVIRSDILALYAIERIVAIRRKNRSIYKRKQRYAYIIDQIVHPAEVDTFRTVYGSSFILISIYEDEDSRRSRLIDQLQADAEYEGRTSESLADELILKDRGDRVRKHQQAVERTFHRADVFIDVADPQRKRPTSSRSSKKSTKEEDEEPGLSSSTLRRLFEQIFSGSRYGASKHEVAMSFAYSAALRSGSLARRVGAAIVTADGTLMSAGYNEVPAPGGGQYPVHTKDGIELDFRDDNFTPDLVGFAPDDRYGYDANDMIKFEIFRDLIQRLREVEYLSSEMAKVPDAWTMLKSDDDGIGMTARGNKAAVLRDAELFDVIEFSRSVHAEMSALMSALRHSIPVRGCYLYTTTFPCHECARHIIAAGIDRVVYVEPYPKSRVVDLHEDAIVMGRRTPKQEDSDRRPVEFIPFIGIAPERMADLFSSLPRKYDFGKGVVPGQALEMKRSTSIHPTASLRWINRHRLLSTIVPVQRKDAEQVVMGEILAIKMSLEGL